MSEAVTEFARLLESERMHALRADVDALVAIQEEKRAALEKLLASGAPETETRRLREKALSNVQLIRHLVACLQGLSAPESPTYNADGGRASVPPRRILGRL